jgi:hypothetical protein
MDGLLNCCIFGARVLYSVSEVFIFSREWEEDKAGRIIWEGGIDEGGRGRRRGGCMGRKGEGQWRNLNILEIF